MECLEPVERFLIKPIIEPYSWFFPFHKFHLLFLQLIFSVLTDGFTNIDVNKVTFVSKLRDARTPYFKQ